MPAASRALVLMRFIRIGTIRMYDLTARRIWSDARRS
jgi:hypothetical protein